MLAFQISWHMLRAVSGTSKMTWTDTLLQALLYITIIFV